MKVKIYAAAIRLALLALLCLIPPAVWSQSNGAIAGAVTDPSGAAIPGARITAKHTATSQIFNASSDNAGYYRLSLLPPATYDITYEAAGFKKIVRSGVQAEAAVVRTVDVQLPVGATDESVTVEGDALHVNTNDATTFRQFTSIELQQVPSGTRNYTHLLAAEAGINSDLPPVAVNDNGAISPSVIGQRRTSNSLSFNGVDATNLTSNEGSLTETVAPAPETIQEVKVQTSMYDASTGRSGGGNFQLLTKSGTNAFHGSAYYFNQNEALAANDFFFNRDGIEKPRHRRHEWGGTLGGPIARDKLFFFLGYQRTDAQTAFIPTGSATSQLPLALNLISGARTVDNLAAAFSNPATRASGTGPTAAQISPIALALFNLRNPVTGDFIIPAPGAGTGETAVDGEGNRLVEVRQAVPGDYEQDQINSRVDWTLSQSNRLSAAFYFSQFPSLDPFPDPSSLASPFTQARNNKARTFSLTDVQNIGSRWINEVRVGLLNLNNTRSLDTPFLTPEFQSANIGIPNPALIYDSSPGTQRLGHFVARSLGWSFGGPNDSFNKRRQRTFQIGDNVLFSSGSGTLRLGAEYKRHRVRNNLPEEQATEFEKFNGYTQLLRGLASEGDTQFGITEKAFDANDVNWYTTYDWKMTPRLSLNFGVRWDWFGWPVEENGLVGNFDPSIADTENPINGFLVPNEVRNTGIAQIDSSVAVTGRAPNGHTMHGQDLNNFQPRFGFSWSPDGGDRLVVRGGYGIFFDRPSAAYINTVFSNYPFLREIEVTFPSNAVPIGTAFSQQPTNLPFSGWLPMRLVFLNNQYQIRDNTGVTLGADGTTPNPNCEPAGLSAGGRCLGNVAETFEFRAIDRNLRTPYVQQWNFGTQFGITNDLLFEVRYVGAKGTGLLLATALAQPFDLNSPSTPDYIYERLNQAYLRGGAPRGPLAAGATARERGAGVAFGFPNPATGNPRDLNLATACTTPTTNCVVPFEARAPFLGLNAPEALILQSRGSSIYHGLQTSLVKRFGRGLQFNLAYTWSRSIDDFSSDPGSTAGGGKPDVPNLGFQVQGDANNLAANRAASDFDRTHRVSLSYVYDIPTGGSKNILISGWQLSGFFQAQSGAPYSIYSSEPEARSTNDLNSLVTGSGGLYRLAFGRPNLVGSIDQLCSSGSDEVDEAFQLSSLASAGGNFGNLPRNPCRASMQKRFDMGVSKKFTITEGSNLEFRTEFFNLFNFANFAPPTSDLVECGSVVGGACTGGSFGEIENTIGGARLIQFGLRLNF